MNFRLWLRDPTTINGIGAAVGVIAGALAHALGGSLGWAQALGVIAAAVVHAVLPSNAAAPSSVEALVRDAARAAMEKRLAQSMPSLLADGAQALGAFASAAPTAPPAPSSAPVPPPSPGASA